MDPEQLVPCVACETLTSVQTGGQATRRGVLCPRCTEERDPHDPRLAFRSARLQKRAGRVAPSDPRVARPQ